jgi:hypothetical protein
MCCVMFFLGRKSRSLQSCPVVGGVSLLEEWPLSFDAVVLCSDIRSPVDDAATMCRIMNITVVTCPSLRFDHRREPRPQRRKSCCDLAQIVGIVA